ncbi:MAG: UDP-N-acetyl-D-mannosamine dehydrogenase [Armatimonadota bacterium]
MEKVGATLAECDKRATETGLLRVCVVGLGYIGLPLATVLTANNIDVYGADVSREVVANLNLGQTHCVEPGLDEMLEKAVSSGRFRAFEQPAEADVFVIAVPTPITKEKEPDVTCVISAAESIAPRLVAGNLIIIESTCPVMTTEVVKDRLSKLRPDLEFPKRDEAGHPDQVSIAYCPERVLPGRIFLELVENDRVVGGLDELSTRLGVAFYERFIHGNVLPTDARTAEMCKLAENAYRDVNIAFANELSLVCERFAINPFKLIELSNRHPRVNILQPGPGVGGHCIAIDPWFIVDSAPDLANLIRTSRQVNDSMPGRVVERVLKAAKEFSNPTIACLGLAFKPDVDDLRESPAVEITRELAQMGMGRILAVEPNVNVLPSILQEQPVELVDINNALEAADVVVLLVNHRQFLSLDPHCLCGKKIIDTRGAWRSAYE